jgi:hypothetical protein
VHELDAAVLMACEALMLMENAETAAARVRSVVGTVRDDDNDDENSLTCFEEATNHLIRSIGRLVD